MRRDDGRIPLAARRSSRPLNEDALVAALRELVETGPVNRRISIGIGDDAAVWQPSRSHRSVITTDALVENVHFRRETMTLEDAGARAMAANLSDVAAMGALPVLATVALGIPQPLGVDDVLTLYRGMLAVALPYGCAIAGGDLTRSPVISLAVTVVGEVRPSNLKTRSGAKPGDVIAVTGPLGASRAGLLAADNLNVLNQDERAQALAAHRRPQPRVAEGRWLAASANVHAMMDLSDGLSTDLRRLCAASHCAATVEGVPIASSAATMARALGEDPRRFALAGGEDFELMAALDARAFRYLAKRFERRFGRPLHAIGRVRSGTGVFMLEDGEEVPLASTGWDHLA